MDVGGEGSALGAGKHPVLIMQEAEWAPRPIWMGAENFVPYRDSIP
jgi:hypothetical protein